MNILHISENGRGALGKVAGCAVAVATLFSGLAIFNQAVAATPDDAPSVFNAPYDNLPVGNPAVTKTMVDNSALPSYMRNPIGQNEGINTPDDLNQNYYSADAATLSYGGKLFVVTGHDEADPYTGGFVMRNWGAYVTDDPASGKWMHYKNIMSADQFSWATGDGAYAGQIVADDGGTPGDPTDDWFYYYVPVKDRASEQKGLDPFAIGVAKSRSPLGPWEDAIGAPLLTTEQTKIETIDPAFFVDDDGTGYLHFGTFGTQLAIKMQREANGRTSFTKVEQNADGTPALHTMKDAETGGNGPKGFFEAAWVFHRGDKYYNVYDGGKPGSGAATCVQSNYQACVQYSTSDSPFGPWTYQGVLVPSGSATTMHPSVQKFGDKWYVTYHTGDKEGGTDFRRAVSIDEVNWTADGKMTSTAHPTKAEKIQGSRNVAPYASVSASFTETPAWKDSINDGRVLIQTVVPPNHWTNYRGIPQSVASDWLAYTWDSPVRIDSAKVWFDTDPNALKAPASWTMQYLDANGNWQDVPNPSGYGVTTGKYAPNDVSFGAVTTTSVRLVLNNQAVSGGYASVAVPEWEVYSANENPTVVEPRGVTTATGTEPELPASVDVTYNGQKVASPVIWRPVDPSKYAQAGSFEAYGVVAGVPAPASEQGNVKVNVTVKDGYVKPLTGWIEKYATATDVDNKASSWTKGVAALNDGQIIPSVTNENQNVWGSWPNTGTMSLDYEWKSQALIDKARVQFTSDDGGLKAPASWKLQYWDAGKNAFADIPGATYTVTNNSPAAGWATTNAGWSDAKWDTPVKTNKLRLVITSSDASPAIAEWQVHGIDDGSTPTPTPGAIASMTVSKLPSKTVYTAGEQFDASGIEVLGVLSDKSTRVLDPSEYTISTPDMNKVGRQTLTVTLKTDAKQTALFDITVNAKPSSGATKAESITVLGKKTLAEGASAKLVAKVNPAGVDDPSVSWDSSDKGIATVDASGKVKAVKAGTVRIIATAKDGSGVSGEIAIEVQAKAAADTARPAISGAGGVSLIRGAAFDALDGVTAKDDRDGDLTSHILVSGSVNTNKAGVYTLTYTVADKAGNEATVTRAVTVQ